ncbi:MAG: NAD(P)H-hydrate dehydratase [Phycisphaerae bacterium]|nr:NAD(P)H-hydrate dehydratase [Phycisphaerae bacterium]
MAKKTSRKNRRETTSRPAAHEIEAKIKVASLAPARRALRQAGGVFCGTVVQTDRYFDSDDRRLLAGDIGVRIRLTKVLKSAAGAAVDARPLLTFKGPVRADAKLKSRPETQARVDDDAIVDRVLAAAGLAPTVTVEKRRESWRLGRCTVELDTLPGIGTFVEIEGPDETTIENVRKKLNIQGLPTREHYVKLTLDARDHRTDKSNLPPNVTLVTIIPTLPKRKPASHKGDFGHVLVVGGSAGMAGACGLCANGALRGGAGLVTAATPATVQPIVATLAPCAMTIPLAVDAHGTLTPEAVRQVTHARGTVLAVGPGMGVGTPQQRLVQAVIEQAAVERPRPVVLDADGLNNLAALGDWPARRRGTMILTPHPGEFARLTHATTHDVQTDRVRHALAAVNRWLNAGESTLRSLSGAELVLVLKGASTVVTDGRRLYVNRTGNPGLATGGSGDVLTGLLAALIAQGMPPFDAAVLATHTHGLAADLAAKDVGETSLIATDLLDYIGRAMKT